MTASTPVQVTQCACSHSNIAHGHNGNPGCMFCSCQKFTEPVAVGEAAVELGKYSASALELLTGNPIFDAVPKEALRAFVKAGRGRILGDSTVVVGHGQHSVNLEVVLSGELVIEQDQHGPITAVVRAGDMAGDLNALIGEPRHVTLYAQGDSVTLELDAEKLTPILRQYPELLAAVIQALARFTANDEERVRLTFRVMDRYSAVASRHR